MPFHPGSDICEASNGCVIMSGENKRKIMVVDDDPDILYTVGVFLQREGYETVTASSGEECLEMLEDMKPDLILLDVMMPGFTGWETCAEIKGKEDTSDIPVAMLTVKTDEKDMSRSFEHRADAHIGKPVITEKMINTVKWVLKSRGKA